MIFMRPSSLEYENLNVHEVGFKQALVTSIIQYILYMNCIFSYLRSFFHLSILLLLVYSRTSFR